MTGWTDVALSQVLGGVSEVLGSPFPQSPAPGGPMPLDPAPTAPVTSRSRPVEWCKSGRVSACGSVVATMP
ncbi:hypothetical protein GBO22_21155, partial [Mycobacterium avium subsp. hominissuis]|nr:hypothetical protein [Mycobacterium avium subsp. hominissuis]